MEAKKAELDQAKKDLVAALHAEPKKEEPVKPAPSEDAKVEALQNKVADLEKEVARLESDLKDAEENNVEDYVKEGLEKAITEKKAELEKAEAELEEALKALDPVESSNGDALVQPEVPEFNGEVPNQAEPTPQPQPAGDTGAPAGGQAAAPAEGQAAAPAEGQAATPTEGQAATPTEGQVAAPTEGQKAKDEKVLPNTGMNTSNTAALGLSLIGLIGLAIRRKLSK